MRIVILGDLQYRRNEIIDGIVDDVKSLLPDVVILLGDYGYIDGFGSYEVFSHIASVFKEVQCQEFIPLLGNHDVQYEAGNIKWASGTVSSNYTRAFGFPPQNRIIDSDNFRIFCFHTDVQPKDDFWFAGECYISEEHFEHAKSELEKYPYKPVIMMTHAPPAGSGLLTIPEVHVRASNAYLDQDHGYQRWIDLVGRYRQIIMWFSGHYHIGHSYKDSMSIKDGLAYFITGTATSTSRDGQRHSRLLEEENGMIKVLTFDHDSKTLSVDYECEAKIRGKAKDRELTGIFTAGCGKVVSNGLKCGRNGRVYAMTDNRFLWEIDFENRIATGTLHYSNIYTLEGFAIDHDYVWRICGDKIFGHSYNDVNRFMREKDYSRCNYITKSKSELPDDLGETILYDGKVACKLHDDLICATFNDSDGKLYFEILKR